jgi:excinuclease UvrABC nuclease subunit
MARSSPVPPWVPADLPSRPGVYQFEDELGTPIYVGKSVNLKRRVRGYFYGGGPSDERMAMMVRLARRVQVHRTGTDLEALLEEAERIETHRPAFNRALKNRSRGWYIEVDWGQPFPRLRITGARRRPRAQYLGPFRGRRGPAEVARLVEKTFRLRSCAGSIRPDDMASPCLQHGIDLCTAPCVRLAGVDEYRQQVRAAVRCLSDASAVEAAIARCVARRDEALADGSLEVAASWERRIGWLRELEGYRSMLERPQVERSMLIVLPGAEPDGGLLLPVARGRVMKRTRIRWSDVQWSEVVSRVCYEVRIEELRAESVFAPAQLTPSLIVSSWLERRTADEGRVFDLDRLDAGSIVKALQAAPCESSEAA